MSEKLTLKFSCPFCNYPSLEVESFTPIILKCPSCNKTVPDTVPLDNVLTKWQQENVIQHLFVEQKPVEFHEVNLGRVNQILKTTPYSYNPSWLSSETIQPLIRQVELSEEERKNFYFKGFILGFVAFTIFYVILCLFFPLKNISWLSLIGILIASRLADIISTNLGLGIGATETNPISDPHNISKSMSIQVFQVCVIVGLSFILGLINPWLRNGLLFVFSLLGFEAFFANLGQILVPHVVTYTAPSFSELSGRFYTVHIVAIFFVGMITSIAVWIIF